jgi:hypothetical protein
VRFRPVVLLLVAVSSVFAQQTVRTRVVNNAVLIPVQVNGRELSFLFDTGSEHSAIARTRHRCWVWPATATHRY